MIEEDGEEKLEGGRGAGAGGAERGRRRRRRIDEMMMVVVLTAKLTSIGARRLLHGQ